MIVTLRGCASIAYPIYKHNAYIKVVVSCTNVINNTKSWFIRLWRNLPTDIDDSFGRFSPLTHAGLNKVLCNPL